MKTGHKTAIIGVLVIIITALHYTLSPQIGPVHEILGRAYYIPIVLGGLWFGWKGGLLTALIISIPYAPHAFHGWHSPYSVYFRALELIMYHVIGAVVGVLSERTQRALKIEKQSREEKAAAYEKLRQKTEELFAMEEHLHRSERLAALGKLSAGAA
ncbi:hypothetical protein JXA32_10390 [Candidatus Sumerlaeota bacterium]|nr:hypothetical protein [Candidatus Sumerlaeota bacterium]